MEDRLQIIDLLQQVIDKTIRYDKKMQNFIKDKLFKENNMMKGETQQLLNGDLYQIEDNKLLCLLMIAIHDLFPERSKKRKYDVSNYFTEEEIEEAISADYTPRENPIDFPIKIHNVLQVGEQDFITVLPFKFLYDLKNKNILNYNTRVKKFVNKKSVQAISELLRTGRYRPDTLTLNVVKDSSDISNSEIEYDSKTNTLIINRSIIELIDGFQRFQGSKMAYIENKNIEINWQVAIKWYDDKSVHDFMSQMVQYNKVDKGRASFLVQAKKSDLLVNELVNDSELKGIVSTSSKIPINSGEIVSYSILSDTIDELFIFNTITEMDESLNFFKRFFNALVSSYPEAFSTDVKRVKKLSLINSNSVFAGYIVLCKRFMDSDKDVGELKKVLDNIDFNKSNPMWESLGILKGGVVTPSARKNFKKFFQSLEL